MIIFSLSLSLFFFHFLPDYQLGFGKFRGKNEIFRYYYFVFFLLFLSFSVSDWIGAIVCVYADIEIYSNFFFFSCGWNAKYSYFVIFSLESAFLLDLFYTRLENSLYSEVSSSRKVDFGALTYIVW